ncbi:hypothetical protein [Engelhardtia mirabilis]|uniref:Uncharacterized protein n=1 Tax=Engelhardtia mirabilis TaxID=2528011 RepID=A0A518BPX0_9BACT|nr:hypothetical protein Pla133_41350 [Planctomycetes bacterium Pla133]QDV03346.1 hypothetical protein Pla86_41340 [Planctomycetes bacterium Pla86]
MPKRVYTEGDVARMPAGSELRLGADAIATPSGLDAARSRGIRIVYEGAGDDPPPTATGSLADLPRLLAGEGRFHVEVRGGRVRVWKTGGG